MPTSSEQDTKSSGKIRILSDKLANQIAAGEVVERPASVVKELMENAIDAQATRIQIDIESGGKSLIKIIDNGLGMSSEDIPLAFARHATSKIKSAEDLDGILTLGFRGEALPSIASVSRVRLSSSLDENQGGTEIVLDGGTVSSIKEIACPRGTTIEVGQLFQHTPARKKFLKTDSTEFSHITQVITQQALAWPNIHFIMNHNGRKAIETLPSEQLLYRIAELFGGDLTKELVRVELLEESYRLTGYISNPVFTRASRSAQYCFVNGRYVRDKVILHATQHGYSHLLPKGRHPLIFLFLEMDPRLLDVNVHPNKAEVRFAFQQDVHRLVSEGVRSALSNNKSDTDVEPDIESEERPESVSGSPTADITDYRTPASNMRGEPSQWDSSQKMPRGSLPDLERALRSMTPQKNTAIVEGTSAYTRHALPTFDRKPIPVANVNYAEFEAIGQLDNSFIILQGKKGIVIVDQHIAHERVLYERFRDAAKNKKIDVQQLLFPLTIEFPPGEAQLLRDKLDILKELGLEVEPFGQNEFLLRAVPAMLKNDDHESMLREIVDMLPRNQGETTLKDRFEEITVMMSCRNAIKVNQRLGPDQISSLLSDLEKTEMPYTCPHGRPISLFFDIEDILRKFLRK
jgi:DNA mismatch repair protein MutL